MTSITSLSDMCKNMAERMFCVSDDDAKFSCAFCTCFIVDCIAATGAGVVATDAAAFPASSPPAFVVVVVVAAADEGVAGLLSKLRNFKISGFPNVTSINRPNKRYTAGGSK